MIVRILLAALGLVGIASGVAHAQIEPSGTRQPWLALDAEAGAAYRSGHEDHWVAAFRAGAGIAAIDDAGFSSLTATIGYQPRPALSFGLAAEVVRFSSGLGFSAGGGLDTDRVWSVSAGPSLSLLKLQGVLCFDDPRTKAIVLTARIPIGIVLYALARSTPGS